MITSGDDSIAVNSTRQCIYPDLKSKLEGVLNQEEGGAKHYLRSGCRSLHTQGMLVRGASLK